MAMDAHRKQAFRSASIIFAAGVLITLVIGWIGFTIWPQFNPKSVRLVEVHFHYDKSEPYVSRSQIQADKATAHAGSILKQLKEDGLVPESVDDKRNPPVRMIRHCALLPTTDGAFSVQIPDERDCVVVFEVPPGPNG